MKPLVAIVGRPNVGKSMLFNKLIGQRLSIVEDTPGVTRDRIYGESEWCGRKFRLVDTGGIEPRTDDQILSFMREQAEIAIQHADVIIFLTDVKTGLTASDQEVANMLLRSRKPIVLAVNKMDSTGRVDPDFYEFYNLGLGDPIAVSAVHGHGTGDLLDACLQYFPPEDDEEEDEDVIKVAIIGKPNVGKSSLINMLTDSPTLAKVSSTPGKTKLINHFLINNSWYLVDLPGYGYARVSKSERREFSKLILDYVLQREQMHFLFVLVDSRLEPQKIDVDFITLLGEHGIPFGIVFTKCDKLSSNQTESNIARYRRTLLTEWEELPPMFRTSSEKRQGREAILDFIGNCLTAAAPNE